MARLSLLLSSIIFSLFLIACKGTPLIDETCKATLYNDVCLQTLTNNVKSTEPTPQELAEVSLSESVSKTEAAKGYISQLINDKTLGANEQAAIKDCFDGVSEGLEQLKQSIMELKELSIAKGNDFVWHKGNVQTWLSAAVTNQNDCTDNFSEAAVDGKTKNALEEQVGGAMKVTSNALAIVNTLQ